MLFDVFMVAIRAPRFPLLGVGSQYAIVRVGERSVLVRYPENFSSEKPRELGRYRGSFYVRGSSNEMDELARKKLYALEKELGVKLEMVVYDVQHCWRSYYIYESGKTSEFERFFLN